MTADAREAPAIEAFLRAVPRELRADEVMVSSSVPPGRISVVYGAFTDRRIAVQTVAKLPTSLTRFSPYVRTVQAVRDDVAAPLVIAAKR
jgi:hypothetical protein